MGIFIVCISIIRPMSRFVYTNFIISLVIKIFNFNGILNMVHLAMLVIFHVNIITYQNFNLPQNYCIFARKKSFFEMKNFKLITWYPNKVQIM
jgi:hypothetical protein